MFRHAGKKGQEGVTLTTLLLIVLGAVVVVVIILGATGGFEYVFGLFDFGPQDLQKVVIACEAYGSGGLRADYCSTFREVEINGVKQHVTCYHSPIQDQLAEDKKLEGGCPNSESATRDFCLSGSVKGSDFSKSLVNGQTCGEILNFGMVDSKYACNSEFVSDVTTCPSGTVDLTSSVAKLVEGDKCCVPRTVSN